MYVNLNNLNKMMFREWLGSDKTLHAMRDHPWHGVPIMGGGWGSRLDTEQRRQRWADSWRRMRGDARVHASAATGKGADQDLLRAHVWGVWARGDSMHHDAYTCHMFPGSTAWPTQRINTTDHNFFGAVGPVEFMQVCPEQRRRNKAMRRTGFTAIILLFIVNTHNKAMRRTLYTHHNK